MPVARALAMYLHMIREWADEKRIDEIENALRPPAGERDPVTGLPYGFADESDEWAEWERQIRH